jgi:prepilin-type N-terminal cleavage/methylation domain-containing protein
MNPMTIHQSTMKSPIKNPANSAAHSRRARRAGLTLIELLVVLVILTGIGGLLIPTINNALSRTHVATCAANFPEVHQMFQRVQLEFGQFGTGFDSGIETGSPTASVNGYEIQPLTAGEAAALANVGILGVVDHDPAAPGYNVTFNIGSTPRTLEAGGNLITLTPAQADDIFLPTANGEKYVWLGIGRNWSHLGNLAPEPPVHFGDTVGQLPNEVHSRFGGVFLVSNADGPLTRARFTRVTLGLDGVGFETADEHLEVYWQDLNQS